MNKKPIHYREEVSRADIRNARKILESSGFFSEEEVEIAVQCVQERLDKGTQSGYDFLFVERAGKVIAYACFGRIPGTKASYELYWIAVRNDFRGLGIGRRLLAKTEEEIARRGGRRIYLDTSSRGKYKPTRWFYRCCGYQEEAFLKDFYSPGDGKIIYLKELFPAARRGTGTKRVRAQATYSLAQKS